MHSNCAHRDGMVPRFEFQVHMSVSRSVTVYARTTRGMRKCKARSVGSRSISRDSEVIPSQYLGGMPGELKGILICEVFTETLQDTQKDRTFHKN